MVPSRHARRDVARDRSAAVAARRVMIPSQRDDDAQRETHHILVTSVRLWREHRRARVAKPLHATAADPGA